MCGGATDGSNGGSAPSSPSRSGAERIAGRTGTARPTTMVLDADVVVEPFTNPTLSESIRSVLSGRDEQRATSRGTREVARQAVGASALDRPYVGIVKAPNWACSPTPEATSPTHLRRPGAGSGTSCTPPNRPRPSRSTRRSSGSPTAQSTWARAGRTTSCPGTASTVAVWPTICRAGRERTGCRRSLSTTWISRSTVPTGEARGLRLAPKTSRESVASVCWRIRPAQCSRHEAASEGETGVVAQPPASGLRFDEENLGTELSVKRGPVCPVTSLTFSGRFLPPRKFTHGFA